MKKRILAAAMCLILIFSCGCSAKEEENMTENTKTPAETAAFLRESIDAAAGSETDVEAVGEWTPDEAALAKLKEETAKLTDKGYDVGYVMIDAKTGCGVCFNPDEIMCSQSTIKGPYMASLYEAQPESFEADKDDIKLTLQISDNDAYETVRHKYHSDPIRTWTTNIGLRDQIAAGLYVQYSAREFAKLWTEMYRFFKTTDNVELKDFYIGSRFSCTYNQLGKEYTVRSKAGWEDGIYGGSTPAPQYLDKNPYNDEVATNDGALVEAENGDYIFVILSDVPAKPSTLEPLVRAIDDLHKTIQ